MTAPLLDLKNVTVVRGQRAALAGITLRIEGFPCASRARSGTSTLTDASSRAGLPA